ncbi:MAG: type I methionyl aminopeptidase [Patescibacteria group bacterium]
MIISHADQETSLREGGKKLHDILYRVADMVRPGLKTIELDQVAERLIRELGGVPSFKKYRTRGTAMAYPASLCVSVNDEIVHGIPGERVLEEGDIVGLDIGMQYQGIFTDTAITVPVGSVSEESADLIKVTRQALDIGIQEARVGGCIGDIGAAIQSFVEGKGYAVVRELVGHGVGDAVHEDPEVPNWGTRGVGGRLVEGMVLALEPMVVLGSRKLKTDKTGWVWLTADGKSAAHFEHTILLTAQGPQIMT